MKAKIILMIIVSILIWAICGASVYYLYKEYNFMSMNLYIMAFIFATFSNVAICKNIYHFNKWYRE